jgi:hypothetical protein
MSQRNERSTGPELDGMTHWLIRHAAGLAPDCLSSRLEEEWLADSESRSSTLSRLRFAVGCYWATMVITHDYPRDRVPAASAVAAAGGFGTLTDRNFGYVSLRSGTLFLIVGIYAALFCGVTTTLLHTRASAVSLNSQHGVLDDGAMPIEIIRLSPAK